MNEVTEHYAMDVPRLTRIVEPEEHAGKLIMSVEYDRRSGSAPQVRFIIDSGEVLWVPAHTKVKVETGMERTGKLAWARAVANGEHPAVADERQVIEIAEQYSLDYDSVIVSPPDEVGRVRIVGIIGDVEMRVTVVSPDGTVTVGAEEES